MKKNNKTSLIELYPNIAKEWHPQKNGDLTPCDVTPGTQKKVWWKCAKGHEYEAEVLKRTQGRGCPYCANKRVLVGYNDLATTNPDVAAEWHPIKNGNLTPYDVTAGSGKKVWWVCDKGHEYETSIRLRTGQKTGCPYCSNKKVLAGYNDLATTNPDVAAEWHPTKNGNLTPYDVTAGSGKKVWWKCDKGHEYEASPSTRTGMKTGCPYCANKRVLTGYNDLATTNPELVLDWDYDKNTFLPSEVVVGTGEIIHWKCHICGGKWVARGADRRNGVGCPICSNKSVAKGINDLATTNPDLAAEWNYEKNNGLTPDMFVEGSKKKVWWKCKTCGHEWAATIDDRRRGRGCPACMRRMQSSFPEQAIFYYVSQTYPDSINGYKDIFENSMELDIYIPSLKIGIEYDGIAWHSSKYADTRESKKYNTCKQKGIKLIRIREDTKAQNSNCDILLYANSSLDETIKQLSAFLNVPNIDVEKDRMLIMNRYYSSLKTNSLAEKNKELAAEWNYDKNKGLLPSMFSSSSGESVWWICPKGHEYKATIAHRNNGKGCPYCSGQKVLPGFNDLASTCPELAKEWDYEKNGDLLPSMITAKSGKKVWWKCKHGHSWEAKPLDRHRSGCPYCSTKKKKVMRGINDLESQNPKLAEEWDYNKNKGKYPYEYTLGSNEKVYWRCKKCNYSWAATIWSRNKGCGCPQCAIKNRNNNRKVKVLCVETGRIYNSIVDAAEDKKIDRRLISHCLHKRQKTAAGYHWQIYDENSDK